jgi:hypothetical protein
MIEIQGLRFRYPAETFALEINRSFEADDRVWDAWLLYLPLT